MKGKLPCTADIPLRDAHEMTGTNSISVCASARFRSAAHTDRPFFETGDVGGQKTLRTYWKNYFEKTDTLIWVVDATDRERIDDCRQELKGLLVQEVRKMLAATITKTTDTRSQALDGRQPTRLQKQERRAGLNERGRDSRGQIHPLAPGDLLM